MRKNKKGIISVATLAFVASLSCGVALANVNASAAGETDPVASLALETNAKVKVGTTADDSGFSYVLKMNAVDYETMTGANSAYSDVTFGVLIAPEYYHEIYNLNEKNVFSDEAVYYWEGVEDTAGKEELINLTGNLVAWEGDTQNVYFRASLLDVLGTDSADAANNIALDFRGVGYVKYTLDGVTKYVLVDDDGALGETNDYDNDNVASMAYVAQEEIKSNNALLETETDETAIATLTAINNQLQNDYLANVNWKLNATTESATLDPLTQTTITIPTSVKALDNTFYADKYDVAWTFGGNAVTAGATIDSPTLSGVYELVATATRKTNADDVQVVYTKTFTVETPKVGGNAIFAQGVFTYDANTGLYETRSSGLKQFFVDSVTDGDYVVESMITTTYKDGGMYMPGIIIGTGAYDNYIVLKGMGGSGRLYITVRTSTDDVYKSTECYISNNVSGADVVGGTTGYTVARVNGTYCVYNKTGVFVCAIDNTGIYPNGSSTVSYESGQSETAMFANLATYYTKGNENIVGIYTNPFTANTTMGYSYDVTVTKGTDAAASYAWGALTLNGVQANVQGNLMYNATSKLFGVDTTTDTYWDDSTSGQWMRQYLYSTKTSGDYALDVNINVAYRKGGYKGHYAGIVISAGVEAIQMSVDPYDSGSGKLIVRLGGVNYEIYGFNKSYLINTQGTQYPFSVARLNNVIYVYDYAGTLAATFSASGVTLMDGFTTTISETNLATFNTALATFFGADNANVENAIGIYSQEAIAQAGVTLWYTLDMEKGTTAAQNKVGA